MFNERKAFNRGNEGAGRDGVMRLRVYLVRTPPRDVPSGKNGAFGRKAPSFHQLICVAAPFRAAEMPPAKSGKDARRYNPKRAC